VEWSLLASLDEEERRRVLAAARRRAYDRGDVVVHEGDPSDSLHLVAAGRLAVRVSTSDGENATINLLGPGDYFGELSLLEGSPPVRSATVVALERAETLSLSAGEFRELRRRHPAANQLLLFLMARRVEELSARLLEAMYDGLDRRVHRRLAELAELYGEGRRGPVVVPLTQEHLAELVGGTRPSVNQVLQRLAERGVVELGRGRVTVVDRDALEDDSG
jgi:CRP-like cAMP-binding protein